MTDWDETNARETNVDKGRCIWCKHPIQTTEIPVGDTETICLNCLGDLRQFKRTQYVQVVASEGFDVSAQTIAEAVNPFHEKMVELFGEDPAMYRMPDMQSNAETREPL